MNLILKWGNIIFELQGHTHLMALKDVAFITPQPTNFPMTISSNLNQLNSNKPFTMNLKKLLNMAKTLTFSTHKRIKILFQPCTTYKWIDNHYACVVNCCNFIYINNIEVGRIKCCLGGL